MLKQARVRLDLPHVSRSNQSCPMFIISCLISPHHSLPNAPSLPTKSKGLIASFSSFHVCCDLSEAAQVCKLIFSDTCTCDTRLSSGSTTLE